MVWWNPGTWFSPSTPTAPSSPTPSASTNSSSSTTAPTSSSQNITNSTGTGYNPAIGANEGKPTTQTNSNLTYQQQQKLQGLVTNSPNVSYSPQVLAQMQKQGIDISGAKVYVTDKGSQYTGKVVNVPDYVDIVQPQIMGYAQSQSNLNNVPASTKSAFGETTNQMKQELTSQIPYSTQQTFGETKPEYSIYPGGPKYTPEQIASFTPSLAFWTRPIQTTGEYLKYKIGVNSEQQYNDYLYSTSVKDIYSGRTFDSSGVFKVQPTNTLWENYLGLRSASPIVRVAEAGAIAVPLGFAYEGITVGATAISPAVGSVTKLGLIGGGLFLTGKYGYEQYKSIEGAKTQSEKYEILGETIGTLGIAGLGFSSGRGVFSVIQGEFATMGRTYIPLSKLTKPEVISGEEVFPTIPKAQQLKAFQTGSYGEYTQPIELTQGTPGAFHTTAWRFYGNEIKPTAGTSELPGLYGSVYLSPEFAKVNQYRLFPSFRGFLNPAGKPGVAFLQPESFRQVSFGTTADPTFTGQKSIGGRYAFFTSSAEKGVADVPLMKTEAEAIFRTDAGNYQYKSGEFYTKIKGVKTPIDVFSSNEKVPISTETAFGSKENLIIKTNIRGGYSIPESYPVTTPIIITGIISKPSTISLASSYSSPSYSSVTSSISSQKSISSSVSIPNSSSLTKTSSTSYKSPTSRSILSSQAEPSSVYIFPSKSSLSIPRFGMKFGGASRIFKGKRKYGYSPDFRSISLGLKGKAPKRSSYFGYGEQARPIVGGKGLLASFDDRIKLNLKTKAKSFLKGGFK